MSHTKHLQTLPELLLENLKHGTITQKRRAGKLLAELEQQAPYLTPEFMNGFRILEAHSFCYEKGAFYFRYAPSGSQFYRSLNMNEFVIHEMVKIYLNFAITCVDDKTFEDFVAGGEVQVQDFEITYPITYVNCLEFWTIKAKP